MENEEQVFAKVKLTHKNGEVISAKAKSVLVFYEGTDGKIRCFGEHYNGFLQTMKDADFIGQVLKSRSTKNLINSNVKQNQTKIGGFGDPNQMELGLDGKLRGGK